MKNNQRIFRNIFSTLKQIVNFIDRSKVNAKDKRSYDVNHSYKTWI